MAERLVLAVLAQLPERTDLRASMSAAPLGRIEVEWSSEPELRWLVDPTALPWPGVSVRSYVAEDEESLRLRATTFHLAASVVEQTVEVLGKRGRK